MFRKLMFGGAVILALLVLLGMSGRIFAPGDSLAIVRPLASVLLVVCAVALWWVKARRAALLALIPAAVALTTVLPGFFAAPAECPAPSCLKLYQKNLLSKAWPRYSLADDIIASGAEIVTLQEVSAHNIEFMGNMFEHYTTALHCTFRPAQDVAVLTSLPAVEDTAFCLAETGLAGVQVVAPNGQKIWAVSLHLEWPYPFDQAPQSAAIAKHIATLEGPVLIGGDFNMVPWGASVQRIARAADGTRLGAARNTYRSGRFWLPLPVDAVLVPTGATGRIEHRGYMGSDHIGLLAHIALP